MIGGRSYEGWGMAPDAAGPASPLLLATCAPGLHPQSGPVLLEEHPGPGTRGR